MVTSLLHTQGQQAPLPPHTVAAQRQLLLVSARGRSKSQHPSTSRSPSCSGPSQRSLPVFF